MSVINARNHWHRLWRRVVQADLPDLLPPKTFKPKFDLPLLKEYSKAAPESFWNSFPSNLQKPATSLVCYRKLKAFALEAGWRDLVLLDKICSDLRNGANLGCKGDFRKAGAAKNAPSAFTDGEKVTDAIADWLEKGFAYGPVPWSEVPPSAKFSGIMTRAKPTGSVRIILNLSSPKGSAVNEGINNQEFPAVMSSTTKWLRALWAAGRNCWISKTDWSDAYKHCAVREEDLPLQWFSWLGMNFME